MKTIFEYIISKSTKRYIIKANNDTIHQIVKDELDRLGHNANFNHIDVSEVTNMDSVFSCYKDYLGLDYQDLNPDISKWNVSNVENMGWMFYNCSHFNQDLSEWDVGNVTNMDFMFQHCMCFNQDLYKWNVRKVKSMNHMFEGCSNFNQDLSGWDVSNVNSNFLMFLSCPIEEKYEPHFKK